MLTPFMVLVTTVEPACAGAGSPSTAVANLVGSLAVLLSTLFGGFLLSRKQMPALVGWVARLSFIRCGCCCGQSALKQLVWIL